MLPRVAVRTAVRRRGARLAAPRRTFFGGGAIVEDYETKKVMARRAKLRRFQAALGSARGDGAWQLASSALQEQATEGSFRDRAHLQSAVDAARAKLEPLHAEPTVLRLEEPTVPIPGVPDESGGSGEAAGAPSAGPLAEAGESRVEKAMLLPHRVEAAKAAQEGASAADASAATTGSEATTGSSSDAPDDTEPLPLSDAQADALGALRLDLALGRLPDLWASLLAPAGTAEVSADGGAPLRSVLDVAAALGSSDTSELVGLHLRALAPATAASTSAPSTLTVAPSVSDLRAASTAAVRDALPFFFEVCRRTDLLSKDEAARLDAMQKSPAFLTKAVGQRSTWAALRHAVWNRAPQPPPAGSAQPDVALGDVIATHASYGGAGAPMFAALATEADLHRALGLAFFARHDRLTNRRARLVLTAKGTGLFFALNMLDFTLSNV